MKTESAPKWHVARWPTLAWLETIIKLAALIIGIMAGANALAAANLAFPTGFALVQFVILIILSLGLVTAVFDCIADREKIAMIFVVMNNLGHGGMVLGLAAASERLLWFAGLMLLGDLVKLWFIRVHNFTVRDFSPRVLYALTLLCVISRRRHERKLNTMNENGARSARPQGADEPSAFPFMRKIYYENRNFFLPA